MNNNKNKFMKTLEQIFTSIITPTQSNGQMLYYGLLLYFLANIFVTDFVSIILVALIISIMIGYKGFVSYKNYNAYKLPTEPKKTVGLMDFVFGIAPSLLIYFEIIL